MNSRFGIIILFSFFLDFSCVGQNLVPNPSFEVIDTCPYMPLLTFDTTARPVDWYNSGETPDYFNRCVDSITSVPLNAFAFQEPQDGDAYAGLFCYTSISVNYREHIGAELESPMVIGETYYASLYANAGFGGNILWQSRATNNIGLLFTMDKYERIYYSDFFPNQNRAHVRSLDVVNDTVGWTLISGSFVADSAYQYVRVGNHFDIDSTTLEWLDPDTIMGSYNAYTLVDNICVSIDPNGCPMVNSLPEITGDVPQIFPNPASNLINIVWSENADSDLKVYDVSGRVIWQKARQGVKEIQIEVSDWARGYYILSEEKKSIKHSFKFVLM